MLETATSKMARALFVELCGLYYHYYDFYSTIHSEEKFHPRHQLVWDCGYITPFFWDPIQMERQFLF